MLPADDDVGWGLASAIACLRARDLTLLNANGKGETIHCDADAIDDPSEATPDKVSTPRRGGDGVTISAALTQCATNSPAKQTSAGPRQRGRVRGLCERGFQDRAGSRRAGPYEAAASLNLDDATISRLYQIKCYYEPMVGDRTLD